MAERLFGSFAQFTAWLVLIVYGTILTPFAPWASAGARSGGVTC